MSGSPPSPGSSTGDRPHGVPPTVVVANTTDAPHRVRVRRSRDGRAASDSVTLASGATRTLPVPDGVGPATVDLRAARAVATTTFDPATARFPPLFAVRADGVVVVRE